MKRLLLALLVALVPTAGWGQATLLQGGSWTPGNIPVYSGSGGSQPVVQNSGPASGSGVGVKELSIVARGTGTPPYVGQGSGPLGTVNCIYDGPITSAAGFHYLCMSANAQGGGLMAYGAGGGAANLPFNFSVNGSVYSFPFVVGGIVGPNVTVSGDIVCWNNLVGTLVSDCGTTFGTSGNTVPKNNTNNTFSGNNTYSGTSLFTGAQTLTGATSFTGSSSGSTVLQASASASGTLTLPAATDTLIGKATTDVLTNKTFNTAGTGNVLQINGTGITAVTGTGSVALAASPALTGVPTAPTASPGANSTQVATTAYADAAAIARMPSGAMVFYAGSTAPTGYLFGDGGAVSRTAYANLFTAIGTTYGSGDGSTTFNIPDCRGRFLAGRDNMGGSAASRLTNTTMSPNGQTLGATGGAQTGSFAYSGTTTGPGTLFGATAGGGNVTPSPHTHDYSGNTVSASIIPPTLLVNCIIAQ